LENEIKILNRDGLLEPLDIKKIQRNTAPAVAGLKNVSQSDLELSAKLQFRNGMTTREIQQTLIQTAVDKIDIDKKDYEYVAARLLLYDMYNDVARRVPSRRPKTEFPEDNISYPHLADYLEEAVKLKILRSDFVKVYNIFNLNKAIIAQNDLLYKYIGLRVLEQRYLYRTPIENEILELPQFRDMVIAMFLFHKEDAPIYIFKNKDGSIVNVESDLFESFDMNSDYEFTGEYLNPYNREALAIEYYKVLSFFKASNATPTKLNAGGNRHQLSSCFVGSTPDNIEGIFDSYKEMGLISKYGGGIGWDYSNLRAAGSIIDTKSKACKGPMSFVKIVNNIAVAVDQLGVRPGAIAIYMQDWHSNIFEFLELKKNSGEERLRAHDIFPAIWISDLFMERADKDLEWTLFDPYYTPDLNELFGKEFEERYVAYENDPTLPSIAKNTIKAKELLKAIIVSWYETGSPFFGFKDTINKTNTMKDAGIIRSSNLCTEILQNTKPDYYGMIVEFVSEKGERESVIFEENASVILSDGTVKLAKHLTPLDNILVTKSDIETCESDEEDFLEDDDDDYNSNEIVQKEIFNVYKRKISTGETAVCNLASINLANANTKEDLEKVAPLVLRAVDNSIDLNFYINNKTKKTNLDYRSTGIGTMGEMEYIANKGIEFGSDEHIAEVRKIYSIIYFNLVKTSALLAREKGSFPLFDKSEWKKGILTVDYYCTEEELSEWSGYSIEEWRELRELVKGGMRNAYLMAIAPTSSISILQGTTQCIEPVYKRKWYEENLLGNIAVLAPNLTADTYQYYTPAEEIDQFKLIKVNAERQKFVDQGISLNIFLKPNKIYTAKELREYLYAVWRSKTKTIYYLRNKSKEEKKEDDETIDRSMECAGCQ